MEKNEQIRQASGDEMLNEISTLLMESWPMMRKRLLHINELQTECSMPVSHIQLLAMLALAYWLLAAMVYLVAGQQFRYTAVSSDTLSPSSAIGEIVDGMTITQTMTLPADTTTGLEVLTGTYDRTNTGALLFTLVDGEGRELTRKRADIFAFGDGKYAKLAFDEPLSLPKGTEVTLHIESEGCAYGNAVTLYSGNTISAGRFDIAQNIKESDRYTLSGQAGVGKLCAKLTGVRALSFWTENTWWGKACRCVRNGCAVCL